MKRESAPDYMQEKLIIINYKINLIINLGEVAERLKAQLSKSCKAEMSSRVRIPASPPCTT